MHTKGKSKIGSSMFLLVLFMTLMGNGIQVLGAGLLEGKGDLIWVETSNPAVGWDVARGVAVDSTGVYVVGHEWTGDYHHPWRIEKRQIDDGGLLWAVTSGPSNESADANGVAVDSSGLYVVGSEHFSQHWRIEKRRLDDGELIWANSSDPTDDWDEAKGVAVDGAGVYVVGSQGGLLWLQWRIEKRSLNDGELIWAKTSDSSSGYNEADEAYGIALDGSGLYVVGYDSSPGNNQWRIEKRRLDDGELIWVKTSNPQEEEDDEAYAVAVDDTGIYVVGHSEHSYTFGMFVYSDFWWRIEKRQLDSGELIWAETSDPSNGMDFAYGVAVDSSGLYIGGCDWSPGDRQWRIERRKLDDGDLIGAKTYNPSNEAERAYGVAIDNTGLYVVGIDYSLGEDDCQWRIEKRSISINEWWEEKSPPMTSVDYDGLWRDTDFTLTLNATESGGLWSASGIAETYYRINDGPVKNVSVDGQPLITMEGANSKLEYWSVDNAGNEELPHRILTGIRLDKTAPTIAIPSRKPAGDVQPNQSVKVLVNVTDILSLMEDATLYYSVNSGTTWEEPIPMNLNLSTNLYEATVPGQHAGTQVMLRISGCDCAGNNATLDGTGPQWTYQVIPEFTSTLILSLFMIATLIAAILLSNKREPKSQTPLRARSRSIVCDFMELYR